MSSNGHFFGGKSNFFQKNQVFFECTMKLAEFGGNLAALVYQKKLRNLLAFLINGLVNFVYHAFVNLSFFMGFKI